MKLTAFVLIILTDPSGGLIWVDPEHIQMIRPLDHHGHCAPGSHAIVRFDNGSTICVRETPRQIEEMEKAR